MIKVTRLASCRAGASVPGTLASESALLINTPYAANIVPEEHYAINENKALAVSPYRIAEPKFYEML